MARNTGRRQQNRPAADWNHFYVYGSAVRQPEALPSGNGTVRKPKKKRTSRQVIKNRHRAQRISPAYATFLIVAAVCAVFICVMYLRLQADVLNRADQITALQRELTDLKESNDTAHQEAEDSVNLETVREKAMNEMGMVYESQGKVIHYQSPTSDYVKQYDNIPEDGVLGQSKDVKNKE